MVGGVFLDSDCCSEYRDEHVSPRLGFVIMQVAHFSQNTLGRDIAVGDIHGCFTKLKASLKRIRFDPCKDRLFSVGDLVDRGPESHHVLQWLDLPWFHAICGNHEELTWRRAIGQPIQEVDHRVHGGLWLDDCTFDEQQLIAQRLQALPLAMEIETPLGLVGMVHADFPYDDWQHIHSDRFDAHDRHVCMWSRDRYVTGYDGMVSNIRALVHGHQTTHKMRQLGNVFFIDTGGWLDDRHFTLLDLKRLVAL